MRSPVDSRLQFKTVAVRVIEIGVVDDFAIRTQRTDGRKISCFVPAKNNAVRPTKSKNLLDPKDQLIGGNHEESPEAKTEVNTCSTVDAEEPRKQTNLSHSWSRSGHARTIAEQRTKNCPVMSSSSSVNADTRRC